MDLSLITHLQKITNQFLNLNFAILTVPKKIRVGFAYSVGHKIFYIVIEVEIFTRSKSESIVKVFL